MVKEEIIKYINKRDKITIPTVQKKFSLPYNQVKAVFSELVDDGRLFFASGVTYTVRADKPDFSRPAEREEQNSENRRFTLSEYMKWRKRAEETDIDDDEDDDDVDFPDDDDDDDEDVHEDDYYSDLIKRLQQEVDEDDGGESAVGDEEGVDGGKTGGGLNRMRARIENLSTLYSIKKIFNDSVDKHIHSESVNESFCNVLSLGNGGQFILKYDDGLLKIIYENFAPADCVNAMRADTIIKEYKSLSYESGQIVATVKDNTDALDVLLELYAAVERINNGE